MFYFIWKKTDKQAVKDISVLGFYRNSISIGISVVFGFDIYINIVIGIGIGIAISILVLILLIVLLKKTKNLFYFSCVGLAKVMAGSKDWKETLLCSIKDCITHLEM